MPLPAGQYTIQCWNSTNNPAVIERAKRIQQCFELIKCLRAKFTNDEIAIPSKDHDDSLTGIEICILFRPDTQLFGDIARFLTEKADDLSLDYKEFKIQAGSVTRFFDEHAIGNVSLLSDFPITDLAEQEITDMAKKEIADRGAAGLGLELNREWNNAIPDEQRITPCVIPRTTLQRLREKEDEDLGNVIRNIMDGIKSAAAESKSAFQVITMLSKGVAAVGVGYALKGVAVAAAQRILIVSVWAGSGAGIVALGGFATVAATLGLAAYLAFKNTRNVLLVVNDSDSDIFPLRDTFPYGERTVVPDVIPTTDPNDQFVYGGFFVYDKYNIKGQAFSLRGSTFGVSFRGWFHGPKSEFSIGMDCPNSILGGRNSIGVCSGDDLNQVVNMVLDGSSLNGSISDPKVDVRIADNWGNVNWGRAIAED